MFLRHMNATHPNAALYELVQSQGENLLYKQLVLTHGELHLLFGLLTPGFWGAYSWKDYFDQVSNLKPQK